MAIIGNFTKDGDRFTGTIRTLTLNVKAQLVPAEGDNEKAPNFHVLAGKVQIGAAWQKLSEKGVTYYTVKLDDPTFLAPIFANLTENGDEYALVWTRDKTRAKKED